MNFCWFNAADHYPEYIVPALGRLQFRLICISAKKQVGLTKFAYPDAAMGWQSLRAKNGLDVHKIDGDHVEIINTHVDFLAAELRIAIANALST